MWGAIFACSAALAGPDEGRALFEHEWKVGDALSPKGDGLGPLYNATSCAGCHQLGGTGGAGDNTSNITLLPIRGVVPNYGTSKGWDKYRQALFEPSHVPEFGCGTAAAMFFSQFEKSYRQTPALFGTSAFEQVSKADLELAAANGTQAGVSGRIGLDAKGNPGRYGWKAQLASVAEFVEAACVNELGLGTKSTPQAPDPLQEEKSAAGPDMNEQQLADLVSYVASLPPPAARPAPEGGRAAFDQAKCTACHAERIGQVQGAWTDLLLHDMGHALADGGFGYVTMAESEDVAQANEWRTPPLWGVAASAPYLHDGRAQTLDEAIRAHDGEALPSLEAYTALSDTDRSALLSFLASL